MEPSGEFKWPDIEQGWPPADWWQARGSELRLPDASIRFIATLAQLAADDPTRAKQNTKAAVIAGLEGGKQKAFRVARSVSARKLLDAATKIKTGREPPITPQEIDRIVTRLMRSPVASEAAKGIEIHDRRASERRAAQNDTGDPKDTLAQIYAINPELAAWMAAAGGLGLKPDFAVDDAVAARIEEARQRIAIAWIRENPDRAVEYARAYARSNGHADYSDNEEEHDAAGA